MNDNRLDNLTGPALVAAASLLRTTTGTKDLRRAIGHTGRTLVAVANGEFVLGWDETTDEVWSGDEMAQVRWLRPPAARLSRAMAAVLRSCWPNRDEPLYPGHPATKDSVLAAYTTLGTIGGAVDGGAVGTAHAVGALRTLDAAGLIEWDLNGGTIRLGPLVATWPARDEAILRTHWDRLPAAPEEPA